MSKAETPDLTTAFAVSSGYLLRRAVLELFDVTEFTEEDTAATKRTLSNWCDQYSELRTSEYGICNINLCRSVVTHYLAYCSPSKIEMGERINYYTSFWDQAEQAAGGIIEGRVSEECVDLLNENTTKFYARIGHTAASVMRTEFFNKYQNAGWELVPEYYTDIDYLAEQFTFLSDPESNSEQLVALIFSLASTIAGHPNADECDTQEVFSWAVKRLYEIQEQFPEDKTAEGRF